MPVVNFCDCYRRIQNLNFPILQLVLMQESKLLIYIHS